MQRIFIGLVLLSLTVTLQAASITLDFSSQTVGPGGIITVDLNISDVFGAPHEDDYLIGFGVEPYTSNPAVIQFVSATVNPLFDPTHTGAPTIFGLAFAGILAPGDFTEPLTLATLTFQGLSAGHALVGVSADLGDLNQGLGYLSGNDPLTASDDAYVVPEPAAAWLLASALGLLGLRGRARRN